MDIPKFDGEKLISGMEIPFEYPVPRNSYPSVIIDNNSYVRHILTFDYPNIEAKKSILIILKMNNISQDLTNYIKLLLKQKYPVVNTNMLFFILEKCKEF